MSELLANYADLPDPIRNHLLALEEFIGDCDSKETVISYGDGCIDDGIIDASDAVAAFNGIVAHLRGNAQTAGMHKALIELAHCDGSSDNVANAEILAARVRRIARCALSSTPSEPAQAAPPPPRFDELIGELEMWPATGKGNGLDAAIVSRLMKRASYALHRLQAYAFPSTKSATPNPGSMAAQWTYDSEADAYYFAPMQAAAPPYNTREVKAILDIANDGTLAGVELIDNVPPPPSLSSTHRSTP